jgi:REP element-mobilizing transposase RayT
MWGVTAPDPARDRRFDDVAGPFLYARVETRRGYLAFRQADAAGPLTRELLRTEVWFGVEVLAYCVMLDHVHLLVAADRAGADPRAALRRWKQLTGHEHRLRTGQTLWRAKSAERVLDGLPDAVAAARFLVKAPARAGLDAARHGYPWVRVSRWALGELWTGRARKPAWWPDRLIAGSRSGYSPPR